MAKPKTTKAPTKSARVKPAAPKGASTADILGGTLSPSSSPRKKRINPKWSKHYRNLQQLWTDLKRQIDGLAQEANQESTPYSMHMADSGTDSFDRDFALSLLSSDQEALFEIEAALRRIENGTYGVCEMTGKPIPMARLEAIPWTRFSVEAQKQIEQSGSSGKPHLAHLGTVHGGGQSEAEDLEADEED